MKKTILLLTISLFTVSCATVEITDEVIQAKAEELDFGDSRSVTLANKAWEASAKKKYPELLAYTQRCVELYGEEGKRMNAALTDFEPPERAAEQWALNDVGTCLYIMANAYVDLEMYQEAAATYRTLAADYNYAQCWDPKGWFWQPAATAELSADKYKNW